MIHQPTLRGIDDGAGYVGFRVGSYSFNFKFQCSESLHARNHPDKRLIRKTGLGISASDIAMRAGKPSLLDVPFGLLSFWYGPKCRNKGTAMFIHGHRV